MRVSLLLSLFLVAIGSSTIASVNTAPTTMLRGKGPTLPLIAR